ncbi:unnamed protein product, partial [marine sediment metagenome]
DYMYDLGLRGPEYKKITAQLIKRKVSYKSDKEWVAALSSMVDNIRHNPLADDIKKEALAVSQLCPVCKQPSEPITLMRNRKAYYCKSHRAVTPAVVDEELINA